MNQAICFTQPNNIHTRPNWLVESTTTGQPQDAPGAYRYAGNWNPANSNAALPPPHYFSARSSQRERIKGGV